MLYIIDKKRSSVKSGPVNTYIHKKIFLCWSWPEKYIYRTPFVFNDEGEQEVKRMDLFITFGLMLTPMQFIPFQTLTKFSTINEGADFHNHV